MGRPVLDETKKREILAILTIGGTRQTAALYVGCHVGTIRNTALRDEDFALRLRNAHSRHEIVHLKSIESAAQEPKYWRAAAWALERMYPNRYGQREPGIMTQAQVSKALGDLAAILIEEVEDPAIRLNIRRKVSALRRSLKDEFKKPHADKG